MTKHLRTFPRGGIRAVPATASFHFPGSARLVPSTASFHSPGSARLVPSTDFSNPSASRRSVQSPGFLSLSACRLGLHSAAFLLLSGSAVLAETGHASFYGRELAGRRTASGEVFRPDGMTAAHRSLPFGSRVKVTNHANGKAVVLRITDRGPFVRGRIIDVSHGAARALGFVGQGTTRVTIERMGGKATPEPETRAPAAVSPMKAQAEPETPDALPEAGLLRNPEGNGK